MSGLIEENLKKVVLFIYFSLSPVADLDLKFWFNDISTSSTASSFKLGQLIEDDE